MACGIAAVAYVGLFIAFGLLVAWIFRDADGKVRM